MRGKAVWSSWGFRAKSGETEHSRRVQPIDIEWSMQRPRSHSCGLEKESMHASLPLGGPPDRRKLRRIGGQIQRLKDGSNHLRLGDECDEFPPPLLAERALEHVEGKHPLEQFRPGVPLGPFLERGFIRGRLLMILAWRGLKFAGRRCYMRTPCGLGGKRNKKNKCIALTLVYYVL